MSIYWTAHWYFFFDLAATDQGHSYIW